MRVLVTAGTGVIVNAAIRELLRRHQQVRLLSTVAGCDPRQWPGVEPFERDLVSDPSIRGACAGCDAVLHLAGIDAIAEVIGDAETEGIHKFVFVSSLRDGTAERTAEEILEASSLDWTIVRTGNVYGPGDESLSLILQMVRALPAVPVTDGDKPFQPIWHQDVAAALADTLERDDLAQRILEIRGNETTSMNDVIERLSSITDRHPLRVPVPHALASSLRNSNISRSPNDMMTLGLTPTALDEGLRILADSLPEQLPEQGTGSLKYKKFSARITGSRMPAASLMALFREKLTEVMPLDFTSEPGAVTHVALGNTLTMAMPLRGNVQVRVEALEPTRLLLATLEGHPLAGFVQFSTRDNAGAVEFAIDIYTRAANVVDWLAMNTIGTPLQDANWRKVVQRVIDLSGGVSSEGVQMTSDSLDEESASTIEKAFRSVVQKRVREQSSPDAENAPQR